MIGNVGDSRAIMGTKDRNGAYVAVQLTVDLKPDLPSKSYLYWFLGNKHTDHRLKYVI